MIAINDLAQVVGDKIVLHPHLGQWQALQSERRFIGVIAGTQGGKTSFGPHWLWREIQRRGPGDYMVVTPTFALLDKKALPEFLKVFSRWLKLGKYQGSPVRKFVFSPDGARKAFGHFNPEIPTTVFFGYAADPDSLESATAKGLWADECGQKIFKLASWEALLRRLSIAQGRALLTTTPYDLGWLKTHVYDKWMAGDPDYDIIRFDSTENPNFPKAEFERARRDLPPWKFSLFYRGIFSRPAGMIYGSFLDEFLPLGHKCAPFLVPSEWPRFLGLDFGGVNTAGVFFAQAMHRDIQVGTTIVKPPKLLYLYRTYKQGGITAAGHAANLLRGEPKIDRCVGGSKSEEQWRREFRLGGLKVLEPPISDVEVGIDRVYGAHARSEIIVFDDQTGYLEQKRSYSRKVDDKGDPLEEIENKATYHYLDAERYIISDLRNPSSKIRVS